MIPKMKRFSRSRVMMGHDSTLDPADYVWNGFSGKYMERSKSIWLEHDNSWISNDAPVQICSACGHSASANNGRIIQDRLNSHIWIGEGCLSMMSFEDVYIQNGHQRIVNKDGITEPSYLSSIAMLSYHNGRRAVDHANMLNPFRIGFEIERTDEAIRQKFGKPSMNKILPQGWWVESDSSLSSGGFEVITRAYNLQWMDGFKRDVKLAEKIINAKWDLSCGGHIHISDMRYNAEELFKRIDPWIPLLMALYPRRMLKSTYCKPVQEKQRMYSSNKHYAAIIHNSGSIELRIFPAVRNIKNLLWRADLVAMILESTREMPMTYERMFEGLKPGGEIRKMLRQVYTHDEFVVRQDIFWRLADFYTSGINITDSKIINLLQKCAS